MILNITYGVLLQFLCLYLNKKINYEYSYKKLSIVGSIGLGVISSMAFPSQLYSILYLTLFIGLMNISFIDFKYLEISDTYNLLTLVLGVINVLTLQNHSMFATALIRLFLFINLIIQLSSCIHLE